MQDYRIRAIKQTFIWKIVPYKNPPYRKDFIKDVVSILKLLLKYSNIWGSILIWSIIISYSGICFLFNSEPSAFPYQVNLIILSYALYS